MIEPLESRIAPAAVLKYTDIDGDLVSVAVSKAATAADIAAICDFSSPVADAPRTLQLIDFGANAALFAGTKLTITVKRGPGISDGLANIGRIDATSADGGTSLDLGTIRIAGDLGQIDAGTGSTTTAAVKSLTVRSLGRAKTAGGDLQSNIHGTLGALTVKGDVAAAAIFADQIGSVAIAGSLFGGVDDSSGRISTSTGRIGAVKIGGNIEAGHGTESGSIDSKTDIASVAIGGSLIGGTTNTGRIMATGMIGPVKIGHDVVGGGGNDSGEISSFSDIAKVTIGGSLIGGAGATSGSIGARHLGTVSIGHDLVGGTELAAGSIEGLTIGDVTIGGSLIGGPATSSGVIRATLVNGSIGAVKIGQDVLGGSITGSDAAVLTGGILSDGRIASVFVGGSLISGFDSSTDVLEWSGAIVANDDIGAVTIKGSVIGNENIGTGASRAIISARGQRVPSATTDVAIGKISITGRVDHAQILAGFSALLFNDAENADAQIRSVKVGGDWIASSIAAGTINLGNDDAIGGIGSNADNVNFGNGHDAKITDAHDDAPIFSKIARITIGGQIFGTSNLLLDRFGFVAEEIGAFKVGGQKVPLTPKENNDGFVEIGLFDDVNLHEVLTP